MAVPPRRAARAWRSDPDLGLAVDRGGAWDGAAAAARMLDAAGFGPGGEPDPREARRGFLAHDASNPLLRGSYKLPFADVRGGRLAASAAGLRAAASRLPRAAGLPPGAARRARAAIEHYEGRIRGADPVHEAARALASAAASTPGAWTPGGLGALLEARITISGALGDPHVDERFLAGARAQAARGMGYPEMAALLAQVDERIARARRRAAELEAASAAWQSAGHPGVPPGERARVHEGMAREIARAEGHVAELRKVREAVARSKSSPKKPSY